MFQQEKLIQEMDKLKKFSIRLTGNHSDADDLLQATLVRAIEKQHLFEDGTNLFGWTSKIMFNIFASEYARKKKFESQYDPESYLENLSVEPAQETRSDLLRVRDAMKDLSEQHREILILVCVKNMQYKEVSDLLGIPVGTVRSRVSRAREQLQELLDQPTADQTAANPFKQRVPLEPYTQKRSAA